MSTVPIEAPRRVRIAYVIDTLRPGGAEQLVLTTVRHLDRRRFEPIVAVLGAPLDLKPEIEALGVPVAVFDVRGPADWLPGIWRLARFLRRNAVDIVHTHLRWSNVLGRLAAVLARTPRVVTTLHHLDYTYWPAVSVRAKLWKALDLVTARNVNDCLIAVSEAVRRDYAPRVAPQPISVVYNYLDIEAFQERSETRAEARRCLGWRDTDAIVLAIGRLAPEKGHAFLVRAMRDVARAVPAVRLVIVGDGPEGARLDALARELGVDDRVLRLGSRRDVPRLLAASDIFVFPSTGEAFGIGVIEAMAAGVPIVATQVDGLLEIVRDGENGLLVPHADPGALAAAIVRLFDDHALRERLVEAARAAVRRFSARAVLPQLEALYASLLPAGGLKAAKVTA